MTSADYPRTASPSARCALWQGTVVYDGPDATITRAMPGFNVTLRGAARREVKEAGPTERRFDSKTEAIAWVLAARSIAKHAPRSRTRRIAAGSAA